MAHAEEAEMRQRFGSAFDAYAARTPRFVPTLRSQTSST
jgi:protein-S-isoprenylcysteine O-methyltransferase Ste14